MPRRTKDDPVARAFGAALRTERERRNLTLEAVAGRVPRTGRDGKATTMDAKYLQSIEQGYHSPTITTALQIAEAMGAKLGELVGKLQSAHPLPPQEPQNKGPTAGAPFRPLPGGDVDRKRFLKEVGIESRTLTRWTNEGVIIPARVTPGARGQMRFTPEQVAFGRALKGFLKRHGGRYKLGDAVGIVRNETEIPVLPHDPATSLTKKSDV